MLAREKKQRGSSFLTDQKKCVKSFWQNWNVCLHRNHKMVDVAHKTSTPTLQSSHPLRLGFEMRKKAYFQKCFFQGSKHHAVIHKKCQPKHIYQTCTNINILWADSSTGKLWEPTPSRRRKSFYLLMGGGGDNCIFPSFQMAASSPPRRDPVGRFQEQEIQHRE